LLLRRPRPIDPDPSVRQTPCAGKGFDGSRNADTAGQVNCDDNCPTFRNNPPPPEISEADAVSPTSPATPTASERPAGWPTARRAAAAQAARKATLASPRPEQGLPLAAVARAGSPRWRGERVPPPLLLPPARPWPLRRWRARRSKERRWWTTRVWRAAGTA